MTRELNLNQLELSAQMRIINLISQEPEKLPEIKILVGEQLAEETKSEIGMFV